REHVATVPLDVGDLAADAGKVRVTVSIGVAALGEHWSNSTGNQITDLVAAADRALYEAKRAGRDKVCVVTEDAIVSSPDQVGTLGPI
ncbi:MAG TPA: diguanylate cyclase, partial [Streptosporangiaceae bacterium]|nr:diguanylate cyclase [Streptosporangiaceae bacterium]